MYDNIYSFLLEKSRLAASLLVFIFIQSLGAQACVLAFSTVDRESFEAIESWKQKASFSLI